jgi:hypothetical protein
LEVHARLSINEDDRVWGLQSRFTRRHPQFRWCKRSTFPYNSQLSFAFPEVREYKLNLLREILKYDFDGVFFDWIRTGDLRIRNLIIKIDNTKKALTFFPKGIYCFFRYEQGSRCKSGTAPRL